MLAELQSTLQREGLVAAQQHCRHRLQSAPDDADVHRQLAQLLAASGDLVAAHRHGVRACELTPDDARCWSELGRLYAQQSLFDDALLCFVEAVRIDPQFADGWHNSGTALKKLGRVQEALSAFKRALALDPTRAESWFNLGNLLIAADQLDDAVECFERAAQHDATLAQARARLAQGLSAGGKVQRAETLFRQSLALDPRQVEGWFGLGRTLEDLGEAEGALGCYLNVIARQPGHAQALSHYLALVKDSTRDDLAAAATTALEDAAVNDEAKALIGYGLLKFHDRRGDIAEAARVGIVANAARRRQSGALDREALRNRVDNIITHYHRDFFAARRRFGMGTDQPVFIVGLPRSGTTLTEQILAAHPLLHGAGELPDLFRIARTGTADGAEPWRAALGLDEVSSRTTAQRYLRALRDGAPKKRLRISDKSPLNFFQLALAALLFPNARVIHCIRDARDNALSIWMENFNADQRYATDFDDLAFYRSQYERLMKHWKEHLPLPMLELHYEETVADVEGQARKLIDFLGAPWDPTCLDFHKNERAVQTPSRWQVRQPVYARSVGRWRGYAEHLPALDRVFTEG